MKDEKGSDTHEAVASRSDVLAIDCRHVEQYDEFKWLYSLYVIVEERD